MPALKNARHEIAANRRVLGDTMAAAMIAAGYTEHSAQHNTDRVFKNRKVVARIAELQKKAASRVVKTKAEILQDLCRNADAAHTDKQFSASTQALKLVGQEAHGMFVNKHLHTIKNVDEMTEDELRRFLGETEPDAT